MNDQIDYWNSVAQEKSFQHPLNWKLFQRYVSPGQPILDYGCGYGRLCIELREKGYRNVIGVDSSPKMIERGRLEDADLDLRVLEGSSLPFDDESFDAVLMFTLLTCIPADEEQKNVVDEAARVLRPKGILYMSDMPLQKDERNKQRYRKWADTFGAYGIFRLPEGVVCRHLEMSRIESLTACFDTIETAKIDVVTMNKNPARAFQYFGRKRAGHT